MSLGKILVSESDISRTIDQLVQEIVADYGDADILLVGVMDGAVCFLADLMRAFPRSVEVVTARATSYEGTESRGELVINWLPTRERIQGRHVLLVEDIVDTGATVAALTQKIEDLGAVSVNVCALLNKPSRREHGVEVAYVGLDIPNVFVVGYGLDYNGHFRNLRDVRELE
ncbi:MAG: hypoxanthine phosphoribosyltransferase [Dehalococcoidia bacterium]|nr:hypoxanthine phosphoribosyltransferase [Dehalococcoidia bacterium]